MSYRVVLLCEKTELDPKSIYEDFFGMHLVVFEDGKVFLYDPEECFLTRKEIMKEAKRNTFNINNISLMSLCSLIGMNDDRIPMYALSTKDMCYGAVLMTSPDVLKMVAEKIKSNFWILPSSIHEVIIVINDCYQADELVEIVHSVNESILSPEEILSDSVFYYDLTTGFERRA